MKKILILISSLFMANGTLSKEQKESRPSELQKKLTDNGVLSSTRSHDSGKTGGGGGVIGPKIQK